ncbi:MAG: hypothetical protein ACKV22_41260 [Bryobacteraceae bacterium]
MKPLIAVFAAGAAALLAQAPPETILTLEADKTVFYWEDFADPPRKATSPNPAPVTPAANFMPGMIIADVVTINGKPAKGGIVARGISVVLRPAPTGGQGIADIARNNLFDLHLELQQADGTPVGTIAMIGLGAGHPPLGAPASAATGNFAVIGGTGPFVGAHGQAATVSVVARSVSMAENPINRWTHPGSGIWKLVVHLIPMTRPEVVVTAAGPGVFHGDLSPVTAASPARPGELLVISATGLGPVKPTLDPGQPFPAFQEGKLHEVNSPVEVMLNGKPAEVLNKFGWPGLTGVYRVDFRVPEGTAPGMASVQVIAAWIAGPEVKIPVQ